MDLNTLQDNLQKITKGRNNSSYTTGLVLSFSLFIGVQVSEDHPAASISRPSQVLA